jgi:rhodanese-related sulfurtransferase
MLTFFFVSIVFGQKKLQRTLKQLNSESVPYAYVNDSLVDENTLIFDTRKKEEFNVSHIENAIWVGYDAFHLDSFKNHAPDKNKPILVYCSIGVRSEDIGEKLLKAGYTNVKNLYGGIFEWKNQGHTVYNNLQKETDSVHAFNKYWGKFLTKGIKVYNK